ncbi:unnamed protein product [[Candida] boidinii]|nr:unnamed protein product [[Candida] boidinii]
MGVSNLQYNNSGNSNSVIINHRRMSSAKMSPVNETILRNGAVSLHNSGSLSMTNSGNNNNIGRGNISNNNNNNNINHNSGMQNFGNGIANNNNGGNFDQGMYGVADIFDDHFFNDIYELSGGVNTNNNGGGNGGTGLPIGNGHTGNINQMTPMSDVNMNGGDLLLDDGVNGEFGNGEY